ncbi:MAG: hypothetical protein HC844_17900 [Tabrizicola sp.]|nr:hypothetical protein [Tabrizicola sp.]
MLVRVLQRLAHRRHHGQRLLGREAPRLHRLPQIHAVNKLHEEEVEPARLAELGGAVLAARAALDALEAALTDKVGENGVGVKFATLGSFLDRISASLRSATEEAQGGDAEMTAIPAAGAGPSTLLPSSAPTGAIGAVNTRRDVERCLDMIIDFYERTEPASPIPLLARRMRKMVPMSFLQLMEEVAPSGMKEFKNVAGVSDEKSR